MYEARDYDYLLTILKTPMGYLTQNGFTLNINSDEIVVLNGCISGNYSSMTTRVKFFLEKANLSKAIYKEIYKCISDCKVLAYRCGFVTDCKNCANRTKCKFWNKSREELSFFKLYYF